MYSLSFLAKFSEDPVQHKKFKIFLFFWTCFSFLDWHNNQMESGPRPLRVYRMHVKREEVVLSHINSAMISESCVRVFCL
jgi:hypothetical protein